MVKTTSASLLVDHDSITNSKLATRAASGGDHCSDEEDPGRSGRDYVKVPGIDVGKSRMTSNLQRSRGGVDDLI